MFRLLRLCCLAFLVAALLPPRPSRAQTPPPCPTAPSPSWSKTEAWVWSQLCTGRTADLASLDHAALSLTATAPWPADRTISAAFLQALLTNPSYKITLSPGPLIISHARVTKPVLIQNATLQNTVALQNSRFDSALEFDNITSSQGLELDNDQLAGPLSIQDSAFSRVVMHDIGGTAVTLANDVFATNAQFNSVQFPGTLTIADTKIGGILMLSPQPGEAPNSFNQVTISGTTVDRTALISNSHFSGKFQTSLSDFNSGTIIQNASFAEQVLFAATDFGSFVGISDTAFSNNLDFFYGDFKTELFLDGVKLCLSSKPCAMSLISANLGGQVSITNTIINGNIDATGASFADSIALDRNGDASHPLALNMFGATVDRDALITLSHLGAIDLSDTRITGLLAFDGSHWSKSGQLDLSSASIGVLQNAKWNWPPQLNLKGLRFGLIGDARPDLDHGCIDGKWSQWLDSADYSPEPYDQLAAYLAQSGDEHAATCVLETSQTRALANMPPLKRSIFWTYDEVAGFGYAPERAFPIAAGFILLGVLVLRAGGQGKKNHMPIGLFYSFSQFIPLVSLDKKFDDIELTGMTRWYFYLHKIIGYVLAIFIAAALTGLSGKN